MFCGTPRKRTKWMLNWNWKFLKWLSFYLFQCCWWNLYVCIVTCTE